MTGIRKTCSGWGLALRGLRFGDLKGGNDSGESGASGGATGEVR
jgi:hypothetical protein